MQLENNILSLKTIKNFYPACVLSAFVLTMTFSVDSIIAGSMLGQSSMVALGIGSPFISLAIAILTLTIQGCFHKIIHHLGRSNHEEMRHTFSIGFFLILIISAIFLALFTFGNHILVNIGGITDSGSEAARQTGLYLLSIAAMIPFFALGMFFQSVLTGYGYQKERMFCSALNIIVNISVSLLAIQLLPHAYDIAGLGIGSSFAAFAQYVLARVYIIKLCPQARPSFFSLKKCHFTEVLDIFRLGAPSNIDDIAESVVTAMVNNTIFLLFLNGSELVAILVIAKTIKAFISSIAKGAQYLSEPLFSILYQERDLSGLKTALRDIMKYGIICSLAAGICIVLLHAPIMRLYDMSGDHQLKIAIFMIAAATPLFTINAIMDAFYEMTGHLRVTAVTAIIPECIIYPLMIFVLSNFIGPCAIWVSLSFNFLVLIAGLYLWLVLMHRRFVFSMDQLLMIHEHLSSREISFDLSVTGHSMEISAISERIHKFFLETNCTDKTAFYLALCVEEIAADYMAYRQKTAGKGNKANFPMDIKVFSDDDSIEIIIRNYDDPYNPMDFSNVQDSLSKVGIRMVQKIAKNIAYVNVYHLNIILITMDK